MRNRRLSLLTMVLMGISLVGCNSGFTNNEQNSVPEFFPDNIGLDISELPDDDGPAAGRVRQIEGEFTVRYDRPVRAAAQVAHSFQNLATRALRLGAAIRADITSANATQVSGEFEVDGVAVAYRADFAPFDIDGNGIVEGTGVANVEPVAIRVWTDTGEGFERFLCAVITARPNSRRTGAGELFVHPSAADAAAFDDLQLHVLWNHTDPAHSFNDAFISGQFRENVAVTIANARVDIRTGEGETTEKTVRTTSVFSENPWGFESFSSAVHHQQGTETFLVSALSTGGSLQVDYSGACVSRSSREKTDDSACGSFDTQDMTFLPTPTGSEAEFPADFPAAPTFE